MHKQKLLFVFAAVGLVVAGLRNSWGLTSPSEQFVTCEVDVHSQKLELYWQDDKGQPLRSLDRLKAWLGSRGQRLVFAANAGMFNNEHAPQGLFVQHFHPITPLDTASGSGNFYLRPNGVFYTTAGNKAGVCTTEKFGAVRKVKFATQSGPMLVIDGRIHPAFQPNSTNLNIRNGVGILPNGHVIFAMSKQKVSLYAFADYFRQSGCRNALYLDGFVSRTYCPAARWEQTDGDFGVMVGVTMPVR